MIWDKYEPITYEPIFLMVIIKNDSSNSSNNLG